MLLKKSFSLDDIIRRKKKFLTNFSARQPPPNTHRREPVESAHWDAWRTTRSLLFLFIRFSRNPSLEWGPRPITERHMNIPLNNSVAVFSNPGGVHGICCMSIDGFYYVVLWSHVYAIQLRS